MEEDFRDAIPCSSLTVDSILRVGTVTKINILFHDCSLTLEAPTLLLKIILNSFQAGAIWGLCIGPQEARKRSKMLTKLLKSNQLYFFYLSIN